MTSSLATANRNEIAVPRIDNVLSLANRELFWTAKYVQSSPCLEHIPFLFWLISDLQPQTTVATGMSRGVAHFAICQAVEKIGLDASCHGFGEWSENGEDQSKRVPEALQDYNSEHYEETSQLCWATVADAAAHFDKGSVDLLLVGQKPSGTLLDALEGKWLPRISGNGVVILSGIEAAMAHADTHERISALCQTYPHFLFKHGGGLLLLLVGPDPSERARLLTAVSDRTPGYRSVLQMFRRLGGYYTRELSIRRESARAKTATQKLQHAENKLTSLREKQGNLDKNLANLSEAYDERHRIAAQLQSEIQGYRNDALSAEAVRAEIEEQLIRCRQREAELETVLSKLKAERDDLRAMVSAGETEFSVLRARLGDREQEIGQLREALEARQRDLAIADAALSASTQSLTGITSTHDALKAEYALLSQQFQDRAEVEAQLREELQDLTGIRLDLEDQSAEVEALREAIGALRSEAEETQTRLATLGQEREALGAERDGQQQELVRLAGLLAEKEAADAKVAQDLAAKESQIAELEASNHDLVQRLDAATQTYAAELAQVRQQLVDAQAADKERLEGLRVGHVALECERDALAGAVQLKEARQAKLEADLQALHAQIDSERLAYEEALQQARTALATGLAERDAQIAHLTTADNARHGEVTRLLEERDLSEARLRNDSLCAVVEKDVEVAVILAEHDGAMQKASQEFTKALAARDTRLGELADRIKVLKSIRDAAVESQKARSDEVAQLTQKLMEQTQELTKVRARRDEVDAYCQELLASTSWAVSAPVRAVGRLLRRMRRS